MKKRQILFLINIILILVLVNNCFSQKNETNNELKYWLKTIIRQPELFSDAPHYIKNNKKLCFLSIEKHPSNISYVPTYLISDKENFLYNAIKINADILKEFNEETKNNKYIMIEFIRKNYKSFYYASEELQNDPDIIREFLISIVNPFTSSQTIDAYEMDLLDKITNNNDLDKDFWFLTVSKDGQTLKYAPEDLKRDREIVLAAVSKNGRGLDYASEKLKGDKEIVLAAVKNDGVALYSVSKKLKGDKKIVLAAVSENGGGLGGASEKLKGDKEIVLAAVKNDGDALYSVSKKLKRDKEIVLAAVKNYGKALSYAAIDLRKDRKLILYALTQDGNYLDYLDDKLREDKEIVITAIKNNCFSIKYASKKLQKDKSIISETIKSFQSKLAEITKIASNPYTTEKDYEIVTKFIWNSIDGFFDLVRYKEILSKDDLKLLSQAKNELKSFEEVWKKIIYPNIESYNVEATIRPLHYDKAIFISEDLIQDMFYLFKEELGI